MAIVKTAFNTPNVQELYNYLSVNATEYFDEITYDDSGTYPICNCSINNQVVLAISFLSSQSPYGNKIEITPMNSATTTSAAFEGSSGGLSNQSYIKSAYKTSKGIMLCCTSIYTLIICKNSNDETCIVVSGRIYGLDSSNYKWGAVFDIMNSPTLYLIYTDSYTGTSSTMANRFGIYNISYISMCPVVCNSGSVLPGVYLSYISPYVRSLIVGGTEIEVNNSTHYAYSGVFALSD